MSSDEKLEQIITDKGFVGWRGYTFSRPHYLTCNSTVLTPHEKNEAFCNVHEEHFAPIKECSCGFYAFKSKDELLAQGYGYQNFLAEVYLWGKVVEHINGYRAQYCYPKKLYTRDYRAARYTEYVAYTYGIEFDLTTFADKEDDTSAVQPAVASKRFSFEEYWNIAFNDKLTNDVRRFARQQVRQRLYMKRNNRDRSEERQIKQLKHTRDLKQQLDLQWKLLEDLKHDLK
jgi:hypothetical protein